MPYPPHTTRGAGFVDTPYAYYADTPPPLTRNIPVKNSAWDFQMKPEIKFRERLYTKAGVEHALFSKIIYGLLFPEGRYVDCCTETTKEKKKVSASRPSSFLLSPSVLYTGHNSSTLRTLSLRRPNERPPSFTNFGRQTTWARRSTRSPPNGIGGRGREDVFTWARGRRETSDDEGTEWKARVHVLVGQNEKRRAE